MLAFEAAGDNGGSAIAQYNLYATAATADGESTELYAIVSSYDAASMEFTLDNTVETSFISGSKYRFRLSATNTIGEGELSNSVTIALAENALQPAAPTRDLTRSRQSAMYITWTAVVPADGLVVDGYKLNMTRLGTGESFCVYDGSENNQRLFYNVTGLSAGERYAFSVSSVNFNGESGPSDELIVVSCTPPDEFPKPFFISSTQSSVTIGWLPPSDMGGCNLLTYELQINDGLGGTSFLGIDSVALSGRPYLTQHTVTAEATADPATAGGPLVSGGTYKVKLLAYNEVGHTESTNYLDVVVASVPEPPPSAPSQNFAFTDEGKIRVEFGTLESATYNGGSQILGYDLWRDDGAGGDLGSLYGSAAAFQSNLALTFTDFDVMKGTTYRYMYRARNINGWGDFSEVGYLFAASVPARPQAPSLVSVDDGEISLQLFTSEDTGGNDLTAYELWMDAGDINTAYS